MIRKALSIVVCILIPLICPAQGMETEELQMIYKKTTAALGYNKPDFIPKSVYAEGDWRIPEGEPTPFIYSFLNPDLSRIDFRKNGLEYVISNYGKNGWIKENNDLLPGYEKKSKVEKRALRAVYLYENNIPDYKQKGLELKFEGMVEADDRTFWLVRVEGFADREELYFISVEDFLPYIKQSYFIRKGGSEVVNYYIRSYRTSGIYTVPETILVSYSDKRVILNFNRYVFDQELEKSDFKNPDQPNYTSNILSFTAKEAQDFLNVEIPITRTMGIEVQTLSNYEVTLSAPLANNINHWKTAFGGSVDSLFLTAGWAYLRLVIDHLDPLPVIVGNKGATTFRRPITQDFSASLDIPKKKEIERFLKDYEKFGKSRITLTARIIEDGKTYATFEGDYVIVNQ
jgi:thioesterase domain-containing protein